MQSRLLEVCKRTGGHVTGRTQGIPAVHDGLQLVTARRPGKLVSPLDGGAQGRRRRGIVPFGQHLRPLSEVTGLSDRGDT